MQYEQYEQEVRDLQGLIEEAHRVIQDRPIPSSNIQELQAQILHHEVQHLHSFLLACGYKSEKNPHKEDLNMHLFNINFVFLDRNSPKRSKVTRSKLPH